MPSKEEMLQNLNAEIEERHTKFFNGAPMIGKMSHQSWPHFYRSYIENLLQVTKSKPIKPVLLDIYDESRALSYSDILNYRNYNYDVIDDETYVKTSIQKKKLHE